MSDVPEPSADGIRAAGRAALVATVAGTTALALVALAIPGAVPAIEALVGPVCHHLPARTLGVGGAPMAVCARCAGMYAGAAAGAWAGAATPRRWVRGGFVAAATATTVGFGAAVLEALGWLATPNGVRLALGVALGFGVPWVVAQGAALVARVR